KNWALKDSDEDLLAAFVRRILRNIYGPLCGRRIEENFPAKKCFSNNPNIERREDLKPDGVMSYHVMLEQLASPTREQQQKIVKYRRFDISG
uniref:Uncharacterized protein n=1 Tax=Megaselia scalaris TaxID=36166 RepID=T1GNQ9_MEGSC